MVNFDSYNEQVEEFTSTKTLDNYVFIPGGLFRVIWTTFGDRETNPELTQTLSDLIGEVSVTNQSITFNVLQTVNREDLQLIQLLEKARKVEKAEVIIHTFDKEGKTLPYYLVASVEYLSSYALSHSSEDTWERPVTNITLAVDIRVRNAATFIDDEMAELAKKDANR